jgi:uncharacterized protein (TIGR02452 family)
MPTLRVLPCADSEDAAAEVRRALDLPRDRAAALGFSALNHSREAGYTVTRARSLPPDAVLPEATNAFEETLVQVANETTSVAARRLLDAGCATLALNFANGVNPGGGFLHGARAQEEALCRSSALYLTLEGDPMYAAHQRRGDQASSDWAILSPDVRFFRDEDGTPLAQPYLLSVLTCAAPVAEPHARDAAAELLRQRIGRVLAIAHAYAYDGLVLGAWGCGAFGNDPATTARDFREALNGPFLGAFRQVVFAVADWSPERRFLGPFRDAFRSV